LFLKRTYKPHVRFVITLLIAGALTMAMDVLWAGTPLLTVRGQTSMAGRAPESIVRALGMPELATADLKAYEKFAVKMATTPAFAAKIRLRVFYKRYSSTLFDIQSYTRSLERAFVNIWDRFLLGGPIEHTDTEHYPQRLPTDATIGIELSEASLPS
jgi:hypothetical protein